MTTSKKSLTVKAKYEPTSEERSALESFARRAAGSPPRIKVTKSGGVPKLTPDHPNEMVGLALLTQALGKVDLDFLNGLLGQLANAGSAGREIDEQGLNFMLSVIKSVEPTDQVEAMLAAQMAAVHMASMTFARRLAHVENIQQQDSAERAFNKLSRTFTTQMEALKRYRTGGEQKMTVQHVTVSEGGQAIVGNVTQASRENASDKAAPAALTDARSAPMPILGENTKVSARARRRPKK